MRTLLLLCTFTIITLFSGCAFRISIEDGCDHISGTPEKDMAGVVDASKKDVYDEIDAITTDTDKNTVKDQIKEEVKA